MLNVPYPLPFITIAKSVAESSLLEESRRLRQTARIYDLLRLAGSQEEALLRAVPNGGRIGVSRPTNAAGLQHARQESLWAAATAARNSSRLARYSEGLGWLGLTGVEEG